MQQSTLIDSLIYIGIVLLILSQITEKITTFIRNYVYARKEFFFPEKKESKQPTSQRLLKRKNAFSNFFASWKKAKALRSKISSILHFFADIFKSAYALLARLYYLSLKKFIGFALLLDDYSYLQRDKINDVKPEEKPKVELAISKLSIFIGFLIALSLHADMFELAKIGEFVKEQTIDKLFSWQSFKILLERKNTNPYCFCQICLWTQPIVYWLYFKTLLGCLITGILLSFGSKFFHDILEILYAFKQERRKLMDEATYTPSNMMVLQERLKDSYIDPVKLVLEEYKFELMQLPNVISAMRVFNVHGFSYLEIQLSDEKSEDIRKITFNYTNSEGAILTLPSEKIRILTNRKPIIAQGNNLYIGALISNQRTPNNEGTLGCWVYKKGNRKRLWLTCYHVVKMAAHKWEKFTPTSEKYDSVLGEVIDDDGNITTQKIGQIVEGMRAKNIDTALIEPIPSIESDNEDPSIGKLRGVRSIEAGEKVYVRLRGAKTQEVMNGVLFSIEGGVKISYDDQTSFIMDNLICLVKKGTEQNPYTRTISEAGDSGSIVFDTKGNAIGMIVAGNDEKSYAIPLTTILHELNLEWYI